MAMKPYRRAVAVTGTYTDRNGEEKKRYTPVGMLFQYDDGGFVLKLDAVPVGDGWSGFINFYEIEDKREAGGQQQRSSGGGGGDYAGARTRSPTRESFAADLDDDIPFASRDGIW